MRRGRLGSYAFYQARDYLMDRGVPTILVTLLLGYATIAESLSKLNYRVATMPARAMARYGSPDAAYAALLPETREPFLRNFLGVAVFLGAMLAMNGIVATDRSKGYYRFLFAKPVSPIQYYGQALVIHWMGFLVIVGLLTVVYSVFVTPLFSASLFVVIAAMFLLYAGIMFLLSASFRGDWLILLLFTVAASLLWDRWGQSSSVLAKLLYVFPPLNRTTEIYYAAAAGHDVNWGLLQWFGAYGLLSAIAGLVVLRYRRMATE